VVGTPHAADLLASAEARVPAFLDELRALCAIDSGSFDADGVNTVASWFGDRLSSRGFRVDRISPAPGEQPDERRPRPADLAERAQSTGAGFGDLVIARRRGGLPPGDGGRRLLLLAHSDTVYGRGTAGARPVIVQGDRVLGPGVTDDKGGLLAGVYALEILDEIGHDRYAEIVYACTPDEEVGSPFSRPHLQRLAGEVDAGFCLECGRENGDIVSARKGVVDLVVDIVGRAAHAGVEPERGRSAALEAAHKAVALHELNGRWPGVTVNVGVVSAGTRPNVVPERAQLHVDIRATERAALDTALAAIEAIVERSWVTGTTATAQAKGTHPPMECTPEVQALVALAQDIAGELGFQVADAATGGAADANTVAAAGVPVLDGLGPVGGDDHSPLEWLSLGSVAPRVALLAGLLARVGKGER
jgi:glutamate carboxypeptidase